MLNLAEFKLYRKEYDYQEFKNSSLFDRFNETNEAFDFLIDRGYENWLVTFSGGKDSTTVLLLALEYIKKNPHKVKRIDVIYSDTLVEIPTINIFAKSIISFLKKYEAKNKINLHTHITKPEYKNRFWVKILGYGYPPPHQKFRWCTDRLKIKPAEKNLENYIVDKKTAVLTGVRFGESKSRDIRLNVSCSRGGECGQGLWFQESAKIGAGYLAPIINWQSCEVWDFLSGFAPIMGYPVKEIENVYNGHDTRFGCWMCTVIKTDKAMLKTIAQDKWAHLKPLADFRNYLWDHTRNPNTRVKRKDGNVGKLRINTRKHLLGKLLHIQEKVGIDLISPQEINYIKKLWE